MEGVDQEAALVQGPSSRRKRRTAPVATAPKQEIRQNLYLRQQFRDEPSHPKTTLPPSLQERGCRVRQRDQVGTADQRRHRDTHHAMIIDHPYSYTNGEGNHCFFLIITFLAFFLGGELNLPSCGGSNLTSLLGLRNSATRLLPISISSSSHSCRSRKLPAFMSSSSLGMMDSNLRWFSSSLFRHSLRFLSREEGTRSSWPGWPTPSHAGV
jgi:hypothetical protein